MSLIISIPNFLVFDNRPMIFPCVHDKKWPTSRESFPLSAPSTFNGAREKSFTNLAEISSQSGDDSREGRMGYEWDQ